MKDDPSTTISPRLQIAGIILDFDGVIVDSLPVHLKMWSKATQIVFGKALAEPQRLKGLSTLVIANLIAKEFGNPSLVSELVAQKQVLLSTADFPVPLLPGAREMVSLLKEEGVPCGIASNAPRAFVEEVCRQNILSVPVILGRGDAGRNKPHPDVFLKCAKLLGLGPVEQRGTLIFEDSLHGIIAAVKSRMVPIGITSQHSSHHLTEAGAKYTFSSLEDFLQRSPFAKISTR